jgi:8-oxo-dGTP pyrophosphatase MutT (NUDIX family)
MKAATETVSAFVHRRRGSSWEFLLMRRIPERGGFWQSVSGKIAGGEKATETAIREVREETGLEVIRLWPIDYINSFYDEERDVIFLEPCFAAEVGEGEARISTEHDSYLWAPFEVARERMNLPTHRLAMDAMRVFLEAPPGR